MLQTLLFYSTELEVSGATRSISNGWWRGGSHTKLWVVFKMVSGLRVGSMVETVKARALAEWATRSCLLSARQTIFFFFSILN